MKNSAFTHNRIVTWGVSKLSPRMKRIVYLASLAAVANNLSTGEDLDKTTVIKLNTILQLANSGVSSLRLPIQMSNILWKNKSIIHDELETLRATINTCDVNAIKNLVNMTPEWIKYSDDVSIQDDVKRLFTPSNKLVMSNC